MYQPRLPEKLIPELDNVQAMDSIRDAILSGKFPPGALIVEAKLAKLLGEPQAVVRKALLSLVDEGLLINVPYKGTYVARVEATRLEQVRSLRSILEPMAAEKALPKLNEPELKEFEVELNLMASSLQNKRWDAYQKHHSNFHRKLYELSGNFLLLKIWNILDGQYRLYKTSNPLKQEVSEMQIQIHYRYLEALRQKEPGQLRDEISKHAAGFYSLEY